MKNSKLPSRVIWIGLLAALVVVSAKRDAPGAWQSQTANSSGERHGDDGQIVMRTNGDSTRLHYFSPNYSYCYADAEGKIQVFHENRRPVFFPESLSDVGDRTFIESNTCQ
jgi:hypothetical protein